MINIKKMNPHQKNNSSKTKPPVSKYNEDFLTRPRNIDPNITDDNGLLAQSSLNFAYTKELAERMRLPNETAIEAKIKKEANNQNINRKNSRILDGKELKEIKDSLKNVVQIKQQDQNLILRKMPKIDENSFQKMRNEIANNDDLYNLFEFLKTINCNLKNNLKDCIGSIFPLTYLIESTYGVDKSKENEIYKKYKKLKEYINNFRTVCGDGNCFYRAVMFRYIEILILNKNADYLKRVIFDMKTSFESETLQNHLMIKENKVKPDLTYKIMFIILDFVINNNINEAHKFFYKTINTCPKFDFSLILYLRYILHVYIKDNQNKTYLKSFPVKIGNLLPAKYETTVGDFLFKDFYDNYLLKFFTDAEKIIIYLTPFVLGVEIDVIIFDDEEDEKVKRFPYEGESEINTKDTINLINIKEHYEIIYNKKDNEIYKDVFEIYNTHQKSIVIDKIEENLKYHKKDSTDDFLLLKESTNLERIEISKSNLKTVVETKKNKKSNKDNLVSSKIQNNTQNNINNNTKIQNNEANIKSERNNQSKLTNENNITNNNNNLTHNTVCNRNKNVNEYFDNNQNNRGLNNNTRRNNINKTQIVSNKNSSFAYPLIDNINDKNRNKNTNDNSTNNNSNHYENKSSVQRNPNNFNNNNNINKSTVKNNNTNESPKNNQNNNQEGFITPGNEKKCSCCNSNLVNTYYNICSSCLYNEIINKSYPSYIGFIEKNQGTNKFRIPGNFLINGKSYNIQKIFDEYNRALNNKNNVFNEHKLIQILQKKICIFCIDEINNKPKLVLPCGCCLCVREINAFFMQKRPINVNGHFICVCGEEYSRFQILQLGISIENLNLRLSVQNSISYYLNARLGSYCCLCGSVGSVINPIVIKISSMGCIEQTEGSRRFLSYLKHYICNSCLYRYKPPINFLCCICNVQHDYISNRGY